MRKKLRTALMAASVSSRLLFIAPALGAPQKITVQDANETESLQSIVLLYLAKNTSRVEAKKLEAFVRLQPEAIDDRLTLIGYYTQRGQGELDRLRLRNHVLWMLEHHPEHPSTGEQALRDLPDDPEGNIRILEIWSRNIKQRSNDCNVLRNAEKFFFSKDPAEAERLIRRLQIEDPANREWPDELAHLYVLSGVPGQSSDPSENAREAYKRVLEITQDARSRQALAGNMADQYFKAGNLEGAATLANIFLQSSDRRAVQRANTLLGRIALRYGDISSAKRYLRDSANCQAMRNVLLSAPMMELAKELLEKGQAESVIEYLKACFSIWPQLQGVFRMWIAEIEKGSIPDFGNSNVR